MGIVVHLRRPRSGSAQRVERRPCWRRRALAGGRNEPNPSSGRKQAIRNSERLGNPRDDGH